MTARKNNFGEKFSKGGPLENSETKEGTLGKKFEKNKSNFLNVNMSVGTRDIYFVYVCKVYNIYAEYQKNSRRDTSERFLPNWIALGINEDGI